MIWETLAFVHSDPLTADIGRLMDVLEAAKRVTGRSHPPHHGEGQGALSVGEEDAVSGRR